MEGSAALPRCDSGGKGRKVVDVHRIRRRRLTVRRKRTADRTIVARLGEGGQIQVVVGDA